MKQLTNDYIAKRIQDKLGDHVIDSEESYGMLTVTVDRDAVVALLSFLSYDEELKFTFLTDLCGCHDNKSTPEQLGVVYHVRNFPARADLRIKTFFPKDDPKISSVSSIYASANWQERETYDFYGIEFEGHPDLRRILNMDEMDYFPLRKEYPLEDQKRADKNDAMFGR